MNHNKPNKPSKQLEDLMLGRVTWEDSPEAIRSWASKFIFDAAKQIMAAPDVKTRQTMLGRVPDHMRPRVAAEIKRLWPRR